MLEELRVENLLLMERAELRLAPGLNVLTGETGAGKTLLAHALDLLLGGKARRGIVRAGAAEAYVEGVFTLPAATSDERIPADADALVLARRVWPDGRTRAYVCGRAATLSDLRELGSEALAFYGQHEHRKLMLSTVQLEILDAHCGAEAVELCARVGDAHDEVRELEHRVDELSGLAGARDRELDLLRFELEEIERVSPSEEESAAMHSERDRLRHLETLRGAAADAAEAISPDAGTGAAETLAACVPELETAAAIDPSLEPLVQRLEALRYEAEDLGGELRRYALAVEGGGNERLEEVEERLVQFARLERKHGGSIAEVLGHAERCRTRFDELSNAEFALEQAESELAAARTERDRLAADLSARRSAAAPELAGAVRERLGELAMPDAEFSVDVTPRPDGCGSRGVDAVELLIAPNPGMPAGPIREIASGGELSRVMLALLSVAHGDGGASAEGATLVFDEIDAGIGGHTARAVGEHLRALASGRQVLCITHLPQVASLAARHFTIAKSGTGGVARTTVAEIGGDEVVGELVRMLGAGEGDAAASEHARALLRAA